MTAPQSSSPDIVEALEEARRHLMINRALEADRAIGYALAALRATPTCGEGEAVRGQVPCSGCMSPALCLAEGRCVPRSRPGDASVHEYVEGYEFRFDGGGAYTPSERDKAMLEDAIEGYRATPSPIAQSSEEESGEEVTDGSVRRGDILTYEMDQEKGLGKIISHRRPSEGESAVAARASKQLFVVQNPNNGTVYVFDNHSAALQCRRDQELDDNHLRGCVVFSEWKDGQPHRSNGVAQPSSDLREAVTAAKLFIEDDLLTRETGDREVILKFLNDALAISSTMLGGAAK